MKVLQDRAPSFEDLEKLNYMTQVCKEGMRVYSPGPFAARLIEQDTEIGGYTIPRGVRSNRASSPLLQ